MDRRGESNLGTSRFRNLPHRWSQVKKSWDYPLGVQPIPYLINNQSTPLTRWIKTTSNQLIFPIVFQPTFPQAN